MTKQVYSEFEIEQLGIKFKLDEAHQLIDCIGKGEVEMNVRKIVKMCRGVTSKVTVKADGTGKVKLSLHCPYETFKKAYGMNIDGLIDGVSAYGGQSIHGEFSMTQKIKDEDGEVKFRAFPNCVVESGAHSTIENGGEKVEEIDLEIAVTPDEKGQGYYEALDSQLLEETAKTKWMTDFTPEMVEVKVL